MAASLSMARHRTGDAAADTGDTATRMAVTDLRPHQAPMSRRSEAEVDSGKLLLVY